MTPSIRSALAGPLPIEPACATNSTVLQPKRPLEGSGLTGAAKSPVSSRDLDPRSLGARSQGEPLSTGSLAFSTPSARGPPIAQAPHASMVGSRRAASVDGSRSVNVYSARDRVWCERHAARRARATQAERVAVLLVFERGGQLELPFVDTHRGRRSEPLRTIIETMAESLKRVASSLFLDALVVLAIVAPDLAAYARWPLASLLALLSWALFRELSANWWVITIVHKIATRITHGLEHATLTVGIERGLPVMRGFTHGTDRFVAVLEAGNEHQVEVLHEAASTAIRRIFDGDRAIAYHPGCGTSELVASATLLVCYILSVLVTLALGGFVPVFLAVSVLAFRLWLSASRALGLLAQRLFTVSTDFASARVVYVRHVTRTHGMTCPANETWFEVRVDIQLAATRSDLVAPGPL